MSFKPWKQPLLTAVALMAGTTAAIAQNVQTAQRAIELGRYNEARAQLRSNSSPEAQYELGRLYQKRDMPDSAAFYFNKAASTTPMGQVAAGRALLAKDQVAPAEAQFEAAAKATKNKDARILTMIAQAYAESDVKDTGKGLNYVNLAQTANKGKDEPSLMVARGDIYLHNDNGGGEAMTSFDRATSANPSYAQAYYKKGVLSVRARNFNDAQTNLKKAIELDPSYAPAYRELADMYYYANQPDLALDYIKKYVGLAEPSPNTNAQYAAFLYLSKKYPEALTEINKVLAADPNNLTMSRLKAYSLYETKDYAGAAAAMDSYMKMAPATKLIPEDYKYQGLILAQAGRGDEGIAVLEKFIQTNPDKACDLQNDLATAYSTKKDYAGAIRAYKKKLKDCNGDLADQFRLASAFNSNKQYPQADSVFNIILTQKPTYGPGYLARARTNMSMDPEGKKGLAKPYYDKYIELSQAPEADASKFREGLVESYGYLGVYNFQAGKKDEALKNFEKVLELDPGNQGAVNNIKILKTPAKTTTKKTTTTTKKK